MYAQLNNARKNSLLWLGLARCGALAIDLLVISIPIAVLWQFCARIIGWSPAFWAFYALNAAIVLAYFESSDRAQTPGQFVFGLHARISFVHTRLTFYSSFLRFSFFFLWTSLASIAFELIGAWFDSQATKPFTQWLTPLWIAVLTTYPFLRSTFRIGLHDVIAGTVIDWKADPVPSRPDTDLHQELWLCLVGILVIHIAILTTIQIRSEDIEQDIQVSNFSSQILLAEDRLHPYQFSTNQISRDIPNLFTLYADLHGFIGEIPLSALQKSLKISRRTVVIKEDDPTRVPVFQVFVTAKGLINTRFQEQIAENFIELLQKESDSEACIIEFVFRGSALELIHLTVYRSIFVKTASANRGSTNREILFVTPENAGFFTLGTQKSEDFDIFVSSTRRLSKNE